MNGREYKEFKAAAAKLGSTGTLATDRQEIAQFGKALRLLWAGNAKAASRGSIGLSVDPSAFGDLTTLAIHGAYIAYADGNWKSGSDQLLELLTFGDSISRLGTNSLRIGSSISERAIEELNRQRSRWSIDDCDRIGHFVDRLLGLPSSISAAIEYDRVLVAANVASMIAGTTKLSEEQAGTPVGLETIRKLNGLGPSERQSLGALVTARLNRIFGALGARFRGTERGWDSTPAIPGEAALSAPFKSADELARAICEDGEPQSETIDAGLRLRAQLRMLRLQARIQEYRWRNGKLPDRIEDAASGLELQDPLSGKQFHFDVPKDQIYRLYSDGNASLGPIVFSERSLGG
ncbi:MAG: hypothetical protein P4L46_04665 [Fimbriimonas sp.]|nr:hypothetical protein [Fimbriimonas sp.]